MTDDLGPQFETCHHFAPSYVSYTQGQQMINAKSIDTRPSTVGDFKKPPPPTERKRPSKGSKSGSLTSKGSSREGDLKEHSNSGTREMDSKEQLALSVINKISSESIKRRSEWLKNKQTTGRTINDTLENKEIANDISDYDFDKELSGDLDGIFRPPPNRVNSTKFKATKIISKGTFKSPKDFAADEFSLATP